MYLFTFMYQSTTMLRPCARKGEVEREVGCKQYIYIRKFGYMASTLAETIHTEKNLYIIAQGTIYPRHKLTSYKPWGPTTGFSWQHWLLLSFQFENAPKR